MATNAFKALDLKKMKLGDILIHVKKAVEFLKATDDYSTKDVHYCLKFLADARKHDKVKVTKEAWKHGFAKLFLKMSKSLEDKYLSSDKTQGALNLQTMIRVFGNYANRCPNIGCDLGKEGAIDHIFSVLEKLIKRPKDVWCAELMNSLLGILHNSIRHDECAKNRSIYRKARGVDRLKKCLDSPHLFIKTEVLLVLAYIVDEQESEVLGRDNKSIVFLVNLLKKAAASSDHSVTAEHEVGNSVDIYSAAELLKGLSLLIINDANKKVVFANGGIPVINRMLTSNFKEEDQTMAAKALWCLAFDETVRQSDVMKESLTALTRLTNSKDKSVSASSKNALWEILGQSSGAEKRTSAKKDDDNHIMISYNWTHQNLALKIRDDLEKAGYKVWIDVDKMEDDILDSMADAVNKSAVVLLCMSQQYHASQNCRSEATYAYKKKKPVIPLVMETDYVPEGWLDILIGTKMYYKVCTEREMQKNMGELKKAIGRVGTTSSSADNVDGPAKANMAERTGAATSASASSASNWSNERVLKWFEEIKLPKLKETLDFCEGSDLEDIYEKQSRDSAAFENDCKTNFGLEYREVLRLASALKKLFK